MSIVKKLAIAGAGLLLLIAGAAVAYDQGAGVLTVVLLGLIVGAGALAALDANQKVRWQQRHFARWQKASDQRLTAVEDEILRRGAHIEAATKDDVLGTVKLMQEQYLARLDRAHNELEHVTAALRSEHGTASTE